MKKAFLVFLGIIFLSSCQKNNSLKIDQEKVLEYRILEKSNVNGGYTSVCRVELDAKKMPSDDQIKETAIFIRKALGLGKCTIFIYLPEMDKNGYSYVEVIFDKRSLKEFNKREYALLGTKWDTSEQKQNQISKKEKFSNRYNAKNLLKFEIVEKKDISYINMPRKLFRIVLHIEKLPTAEEMKNTSIFIWQDGNKKWKEFTIFIYLPEMNTQSFAYGIAEFRPTGLKEFKVQEIALIGTKWTTQKSEKAGFDDHPVGKSGSSRIPLERRKQIYREYTEELTPYYFDPNFNYIAYGLAEKYIKKYNITRYELQDLLFEGTDKGWWLKEVPVENSANFGPLDFTLFNGKKQGKIEKAYFRLYLC